MKRLLQLALMILLFPSLWAQENPPAAALPDSLASDKHRPKIGLVLEGGGALGLAHIGVIEWLEEHRIPVDVIAGTSMGGLVGGIYATGESPHQMKEMIHHIRWNEVLGGVTPYRDLSFRRKEDRRDYPNRFEFGLKHGAQFPSGFNSGQQVGLILDRVGAPYSDLKSFDDLPIPFRCVATDLVSGKTHVFERGSLSRALRSTMSLPAFFSPVRDGNQVYVDGGLLNNLPVDVARRMGAEIVIAVHLRTQPFNAGEPLSSFGVLQRSMSVTIAINELQSMEKADVVLTADVANYSSVDYDRFDDIEVQGYKAAEDRSAVLTRFQVSEDEWQQIQYARATRQRKAPSAEFVEIRGTSPYIAKGLQHDLQHLTGNALDPSRLDKEMMSITGLGRFSRAGYYYTERDGKTGLVIQADEKEYAPPTIQPLFVIDGSDYKNVLFQVGARITFLDLGGYGSEWRNDFIAGSKYGLSTEYYHPFTPYTGWFVAPRAFADSSPFNVYERDRILALNRNRRVGAGLDLGYAFGRSAELRVGYETGYQKLSEELGQSQLLPVRGRFGISTLRVAIDRFDDPVIPRSGMRLESAFKFYDANPGATQTFASQELRFALAKRTSERASTLFLASGGTAFSTKNASTGLPLFSLGGPIRLGAYGANELLTSQYLLFQGAYLYRLGELSPLLGQNVYLVSGYELGKAYYQSSDVSRLPQDGTLGVLVQTVFGPVFFGGSIGDRGHRKFYFKVGRFF
ncbi:MAG TPA: patatin-like phospholipase family protein [Terriglobales bacterium]|nr:patatin-like phospholipase family protein [Terriglobales bacterium]